MACEKEKQTAERKLGTLSSTTLNPCSKNPTDNTMCNVGGDGVILSMANPMSGDKSM